DECGVDSVIDAVLGTTSPCLLLIDDADCVDDPSGRLGDLLRQSHLHLRTVVAGRADALRTAYGHWTNVVRRSRRGVVLRPQVDLDGELWQMTLPRWAEVPFVVGRG